MDNKDTLNSIKKWVVLLVVVVCGLRLSWYFMNEDRSSSGLREVYASSETIIDTVADSPHRDLFSESDLEHSIKETQKMLSLIYNRFQLNHPQGKLLFELTQNIDEESYAILRINWAKKILSDNAKYMMVFGGSSVTAGHDNLFNQSYPMIVLKRMSPALAAAGIEMIVHNIAQGANNCFPSNYCYESMGGFDPDMVGWEQSFNCGHNEDMFEMAARFAIWSKNVGSVYYSQSGTEMATGKTCLEESTDDPPFSSEEWTEASAGLKQWLPTHEDVHAQRDNLIESMKKYGTFTNRFGRAANAYKSYGNGLAVLGSDAWRVHKPEVCAGIIEYDKKITCGMGRLSANCSTELRFFKKDVTIYGGPSGKGASWHPTRAYHLMRGELITWIYGLPFLDALYEIQKEVKSGNTDKKELYKKYDAEHKKYRTKEEPAPPQFCGKGASSALYCETKPLCFTDYHPHYAPNLTLSELIVGTHKWVNEHQSKLDSYEYHLFPDDEHLELRPGYSAVDGPDSGEIHFRINIGKHKSIIVCAYHYNNFQYATEFRVELNVPDDRLKNYTPSDKRNIWMDVELAGACVLLSNFPSGQHVLSLESKLNEKKSVAGISHIMMWE
mmetsp:Transcript_6875/g.10326  ORF Transcript_6875/g.10326 Transcript_6875/m.10326 type:complete len:611 (+) Transcript_6875:45-1877(+)